MRRMNAVDTLVRSVSDSPVLPRVVERLQQKLADEAKRRREFYDWITPDVKAEFINGEIVMQSPARNIHLIVGGRIYALLNYFVDVNRLGEVRHEKALCVFSRNDYEPDVVFFGREKAATFDEETLQFPVPDLAVEVLSRSSEQRDRGVKFDDFAAEGVAEYWIVDPSAKVVQQYRSDGDGGYDLNATLKTGTIRSWAVEGFAADVAGFFDRDVHLAELRRIMSA